ncbi:MAG: hypothetical protein P4L99_05900 [Chthoniobacter sp.]|nr:hypothetical protein [Chthoniobacter sp.]
MKTSRSLSACLLALVTLPVLAFSQDVKKDTPAAADAAKPRVIDTLKTQNLTYGELIDLLRAESGENIELAPVLQNEMAPQLVMRHVTVEGVLDAICGVTGLDFTSRNDGDTVIWKLRPQDLNWQPAPKNKICRVFKASAKEKLASPQLEQLLANISDAARKVCEVNARAQGQPAAEAPVIEAHAGTGIVIVAGTENDVQLVGQVIQAVGGEVVPLTSSVTLFEGSIPAVTKDKDGTRKPVAVTGVTSGGIEVTGVTSGGSTSASAPGVTKAMEDTRKQLEAARDQVENLQKQLDLLRQQQQPTPPKAK